PYRLQRVVHVELDRVGTGAVAGDLLHLQRDVGVDEVVREYAAGLEEVAILVQRIQRAIEAGTHLRDIAFFFRRQVVQVFVGRRTRIDLVEDAVQASHQQRGEGEVARIHRTGETHLYAPPLGAGHVGNAAARRAVARRVRQHDGRLEARHQPLVTVGGGIG